MLSLVSLLSVRLRGGGVSSVRLLSCPAPRLPASADHVIVGGGVAGASTAYHLASLGAGGSCLLLESDKLTSGTTWHSAAMLNTLRSGVTEAELMMYTKRLASEFLEAETGQSTGYKRHGGLTVTGNPETPCPAALQLREIRPLLPQRLTAITGEYRADPTRRKQSARPSRPGFGSPPQWDVPWSKQMTLASPVW